MADTPNSCSVTFRGETYHITRENILSVAERESPRRVNSYFVELNGKRYPPKQLVRAATGTTKFFDSAAAVRVLQVLGFSVSRETA